MKTTICDAGHIIGLHNPHQQGNDGHYLQITAEQCPACQMEEHFPGEDVPPEVLDSEHNIRFFALIDEVRRRVLAHFGLPPGTTDASIYGISKEEEMEVWQKIAKELDPDQEYILI